MLYGEILSSFKLWVQEWSTSVLAVKLEEEKVSRLIELDWYVNILDEI